MNRTVSASYNARMASRPQFSLRTLLLVTVMVCLAAATLNEPRDDEQVLRDAQALLRAALCVAFSTALVVAAMRSEGYMKTFCIGGLAAAALPLLVLIEAASGSLVESPLVNYFRLLHGIRELLPYRWWFAKLWASVPGFGLAAVGVDWLFQVNARNKGVRGVLTPRQMFVRAALFAAGTTCLAAIAALPAPGDGRLVVLQSWLAEGLCIFFAAALAVGALQGSGYFKTVCIGGLLPALLAVVWLYVATIFLGIGYDDSLSLSRWASAFVFMDDQRLMLAAHWALIPVSGMAFVFCDFLFRRGKGNAKQE